MSDEKDRPDTGELRRREGERAREEREQTDTSELPAERRAHQRRADKAAYLEEKLAEAERSEREDG